MATSSVTCKGIERWSGYLFKWFAISSSILLLLGGLFSGGSRRTVSDVCLALLGVYILIVIWSRAFKPCPSSVFVARVVVIFCGLFYYRFLSVEGVLASHGVYFDPDTVAYSSPNLNNVKFWYQKGRKTLAGPEITGDLLYVDRAYLTTDGHLEVIVRSHVYRLDYLRLQIVEPPEAGVAFKVMPDSPLYESVFYPPQGLTGSP
jgi:hypothetical protein